MVYASPFQLPIIQGLTPLGRQLGATAPHLVRSDQLSFGLAKGGPWGSLGVAPWHKQSAAAYSHVLYQYP